MSKNRNRARLNKCLTEKEMLVSQRVEESYCLICNKRSGTHHWDCFPGNIQSKHRHGSGKSITSIKFRSYKTWKHNRKTQYKQK